MLLLTGCSAQANEAFSVTIEASKQKIEAFEPVLITAYVHGAELASEQVEVVFELIHPSGQSIGTVHPTNHQDEIYSIETSFDAAGVYRIISHVDYGQEHEMPEVEVEVK